MANYTRLTAEDGNRGPSVVIFGDLSKWQRNQIRGKAIIVGTDFEDCPFVTTAVQSGKVYAIVEGTVGGRATADDIGNEQGVLSIVKGATDNMEDYIQIGHGNSFLIDDNFTGNTAPVRFEARIQTSTIANNGVAIFVGLGTGPVVANELVDDTGALKTDKGFIGFQRLQDDGDKMDIVYQAASQTKQTVLANAVTLVANTWVNLGFVYNPDAADSKKIKFYVDGVEQTSYVNATQIGTATFPETEPMVPMLLTKNGSATASTVLCDWIYAVQELDD